MTPPIFITIAAVLGLLLGSFANVLITRLPRHESVAFPGSHCRSCGAAVRPWHNIPLLSWTLLRGRCASCRAAIGWRYPTVEAAIPALFVACAVRFGEGWDAAWAAALCFCCVVLFFTDLETMMLPNAVTYPALVLGVVLSTAAAAHDLRVSALWHSVLGAAAGATLLLVIRFAYRAMRGRQGMGMGDVKLLAAIGAFLGLSQVLLTFAIALVSAALFATVALAMRRTRWTAAIPFGTFLCVAGMLGLFFGGPILRWYLHFFQLR